MVDSYSHMSGVAFPLCKVVAAQCYVRGRLDTHVQQEAIKYVRRSGPKALCIQLARNSQPKRVSIHCARFKCED